MSDPSHRIDGLEIDRLLARGGSASVYEAFDRRHSRKVAVKVLDSRDFEEPKRRAFRRELEAMGRLDDHPHVLSVFDSGFTEDGSPYLVMPLVSTGTVAQRIGRGDAFSIDELLEIGVKLSSALETAHQRGILHCDIKPSNLFIGPYGDPLLGDLGISSISDSGVTATDRVSITLRYAAPEVIEGAEHTVRSDLYSLGATLHAMVDLAPPFDESSKVALVNQILSASQPPQLVRDVPADLAQLIYDMMAVDPGDRPDSASTVVDRLQMVQRSLGNDPTQAAIVSISDDVLTTPAGGISAAVAAGRPAPSAAGRENNRRAPAIALGVLVALAIGALALFFRPGGDATTSISGQRAVAPASATVQPAEEPEPTAAESIAPAVVPTTEPPVEPTAVPTTEPQVDPTAVPTAVPTAEPTAEPDPTAEDEVAGVSDTAAATAVSTITGTVSAPGGAVAGPVQVELFAASETSPRGDFIEGITTDLAGRFGFVAPVGCYVVTFVAPDGSIIVGGSRHRNVDVCVDNLSVPALVDVALAPAPVENARIEGIVRRQVVFAGVPGVKVDAFISEGDGVRGAFLGTTTTVDNGSYGLAVPAGCYILTFVAPDGLPLVGGGRFLNSPTICVDANSTATFEAEVQ